MSQILTIMTNNKNQRIICGRVRSNLFKPNRIPARNLEIIELSMDEFEALRLAKLENFDYRKAAGKMQTSKSTFHRFIENANQKIADAIVNGKAIEIINPIFATETQKK